MSLLEQSMKDYVTLVPNRQPDGAGGSRTDWARGEPFRAALALDTSMQARRAERQGVTSVYSGLVRKDASLCYGDYFMDTETGETWRVTSRPDEKQAPASSTLALKFFTAERKKPPDRDGGDAVEAAGPEWHWG